MIKTTKRVSYIIVTKNRAEYFSKALKNVREFITKKDELLVIDGGSTDSTLKVIHRNNDIISSWVSEKDKGESHALNKGVLKARGKYIKILTDDDYFYPKVMKYAISVLDNHPEIDALQCGGEAYVYDKKTKKVTLLFYEQIFPGVHIAQNMKHLMTYCPCGLGLIFRSSSIPIVGLFDTTFRAADLGMLQRFILCKQNIQYLNVDLYKHINYAHSGENFVEQIHRDETKVFLLHRMWSDLMSRQTETLEYMLGLDTHKHGKHIVRLIKTIDRVSNSKLSFLVSIPGRIIGLRRQLSSVKHKLYAGLRPVSKVESKPVRPVRDGRFW